MNQQVIDGKGKYNPQEFLVDVEKHIKDAYDKGEINEDEEKVALYAIKELKKFQEVADTNGWTLGIARLYVNPQPSMSRTRDDRLKAVGLVMGDPQEIDFIKPIYEDGKWYLSKDMVVAELLKMVSDHSSKMDFAVQHQYMPQNPEYVPHWMYREELMNSGLLSKDVKKYLEENGPVGRNTVVRIWGFDPIIGPFPVQDVIVYKTEDKKFFKEEMEVVWKVVGMDGSAIKRGYKTPQEAVASYVRLAVANKVLPPGVYATALPNNDGKLVPMVVEAPQEDPPLGSLSAFFKGGSTIVPILSLIPGVKGVGVLVIIGALSANAIVDAYRHSLFSNIDPHDGDMVWMEALSGPLAYGLRGIPYVGKLIPIYSVFYNIVTGKPKDEPSVLEKQIGAITGDDSLDGLLGKMLREGK